MNVPTPGTKSPVQHKDKDGRRAARNSAAHSEESISPGENQRGSVPKQHPQAGPELRQNYLSDCGELAWKKVMRRQEPQL